MADNQEKKSDGRKIVADNRKARYNYHVEEKMECGIALQGTEVKSIRSGKFSFADAYAAIKGGEIWLVAFHIAPYDFGNIHNHDPLRQRRLLIHKQEIKRLQRKVDEKGYTLVPLKVYLKKSRVKIELGLCKGKNLQDKRQTIKKRDEKRQIEREFRYKM